MRGGFDLARELVAQARGVYADLGQRLAAGATCGLVLGAVELLAGRLDAAEDAMRLCCETCEQLNEHAWLASRAAELADLLCAQSRFDEARSCAELSERLAGPEDLDAQSSWRSVSARIAARSDELDRARQLAEEAVAISEQTDALNHRGNVLMSLAEVMRLAGL
jgi:tetratricopeptide (TPR) repeat protein